MKLKKNNDKKNGILSPIRKSFNWEQLYFFIVLLGILPSVTDNSLFRWLGSSHLDFLLGAASNGIEILYTPVLLLTIGFFICVKKKNLWMLIGLSPIIFGLIVKIISLLNIIDTSSISIILFITYKLAFGYFIIKGHIRSLSFLLIIIIMSILLSTMQVILFVFLTLLFRITYLIIIQNISILSALQPKNLFRLFYKTLLAWSPILLFAIPGYIISEKIINTAKQAIYDHTFIESHALHTTKKIEDLIEYPLYKYLAKYNLNTNGHKKSKENLITALTVVNYRSEMLEYEDDYSVGVNDFKQIYLLYERDNNPNSSYSSSWFTAEHVAQDLEKVLVSRFLPGRDEFELDIELSISTKFSEKEKKAKIKLDSIYNDLNSELDEKNKVIDEIIVGLESDDPAVRAKSSSKLAALKSDMEKDINDIPIRLNSAFDENVPHTLEDLDSNFKKSSCGLSIKCGAVNMVKSLLSGVYSNQRNKAEKAVNKKGQELKEKALAKLNKTSSGTVDSAKDIKAQLLEIKEMSDQTNEDTKYNIESGFNAIESITRNTFLNTYKIIFYFNLFSNMLLILLIIKSYFYVFSRIAFSEKNNVYIDIKEKDKKFKNGVLKHCGTEYSIPITNNENMYLSRKYIPTGRAPKIAIPLWTKGVLARIRNKVYLMNVINVRKDEKETVDFRSIAGAEFIEWNLSNDEEVVFNYKDLVAFSESVSLTAHVSFKISSLFFGRTIFHIAKGPGKLVLMTKGKPITNEEKQLVKSIPIDRIIAWQRTTQFSVDSELNIADLYFSGVYLKRKNNDLIIIDADAGNAKRKAGVARFISKFLLPI